MNAYNLFIIYSFGILALFFMWLFMKEIKEWIADVFVRFTLWRMKKHLEKKGR